MSEFIKTQQELRANLTMQIRDVIESAESDKRGLDAAEIEKINRIEDEIRSADSVIATAQRNEERSAAAVEAARGSKPVQEVRGANEILRAMARGEVRGHEFEQRAALVPSDNTVPKSFYDEVFSVARLVGPMLDVSQVIATASGESLTIPTLTAYSSATIKAAGSAIAESEPTFSSITLGAFKYSFLVPVANELLSDAGFDISSLIAQESGNAIGYAVNAGLTTGTGTVQPTGVVTAAGSGTVGGTGVAGAFTADQLLGLAYSTDGAVRRLPGTGFMASGKSIGLMRTLKDTAGNYIFNPQVGAPDTILGFPVIENPAVADYATSAKSVLFGHFPSYKVRTAGGLQIAQSSDFAFDTDVTTFRVTMRVDGNLTHAGHVKYFAGGAS